MPTSTRLELLEELSGVGTVYRESGELVEQMEYRLKLYQEMLSAGTTEVPGLQQIVGSVPGGDEVFGLIGEDLILELEDGRRLDFFVQSMDGAIECRGGKGLYKT